jgi:hypothetical protein
MIKFALLKLLNLYKNNAQMQKRNEILYKTRKDQTVKSVHKYMKEKR